MTDTSKVAVLVLGMHRSGTSALTRILGHLGCALPADGIAAHADNARGYWEPEGLVRESDRVFRTARTSWFDPRGLDLGHLASHVFADHRDSFARAIRASFGDAARIAIKDPRLSRLVPIVVPAVEALGYEPRAVLMLRSPAEIAASLSARDRSTPAYAYALWLRHMIDAERDTRGLARVTLRYDALLADWRQELWRLLDLLHPEGAIVGDEGVAAIDDHLDRGLRHHAAPARPEMEPWLDELMAEAEAAFDLLPYRDDAETRARIDAVANAFDGAPRLIGDIVHDELRHRRVREMAGPRIEEASEEVVEKAEDGPPQPSTPAFAGAREGGEEPAVERGERDLAADAEAIRHSGLFDAGWYLDRYPDVAAAGVDPALHYLATGAAEGRDPNPLFRTAYYARQMARRAQLRQGAA